MPGVRVVIPSSPTRAYGLLLAAIRDPDPVVFLEPKRIYRLNKQEVEDNGKALPLDVCYILREGTDVTVVHLGCDDFRNDEGRRTTGEIRHQLRGHRPGKPSARLTTTRSWSRWKKPGAW